MSLEYRILSYSRPIKMVPTHQVAKLWDDLAETWNDPGTIFPLDRGLVTHEVEPFLETLQTGDRVLEVAAGAYNRRYYPEGFNFNNVTALDVSRRMLEFQIKENKGIKTVIADARTFLPFKNDAFKLSLCFFGMRYFENQEDFISEMLRVTKPNGYILIADYSDYVYEGAVRTFDAARLADKFGTTNSFTHVENLIPPLWGCESALDVLTIYKSFL